MYKRQDVTRSFAQQLIEQGLVLCNGKKAAKSLKVAVGDSVVCEIPPPQNTEIIPQNIPLDIVYEDDVLLVVNKPKGMVVHPAPGNPDGTLVNALLYHCHGNLSGINGEIRPGIVHRIDKDTSGLLVVAKDNAAHLALSEQFAVHSITRVYQTVVYGGFREDDGFVEGLIGRHPVDRKRMAVVNKNGKYAYTAVSYTHLDVYKRQDSCFGQTYGRADCGGRSGGTSVFGCQRTDGECDRCRCHSCDGDN